MPTNRDIPEPPVMTANAAVYAPASDPEPNHVNATVGLSQPRDEPSMRAWEGLPPEAMILVPAFAPTPMSLPADAWAMLVVGVDIVDDVDLDNPYGVDLFAGIWLPTQPPADLSEGDLVVRLAQVDDATYPRSESAISIEMLLARDGRWQRVGCWYTMGPSWPVIVAPTAAAVMSLYIDATEAAITPQAETAVSGPRLKASRGVVAELIEAGLIQPGDELVWDRRYLGERHTAQVRDDGCITLTDGRSYAYPSGALTALGAKHNNGWLCWKRVSDGRTLGDLRAQLQPRRGL